MKSIERIIVVLLLITACTYGKLPDEPRKVTYTCDGSTTAFTFAFEILASSDLTVIRRAIATGAESVLVETTDYTVASAPYRDWTGGGTVTTVNTYSSSYTLTILGATPNTQETDLKDAGPLRVEKLEDGLDKLTMLVQQLEERLDRALLIPRSETSSVELENSVTRASKLLGFDSNGDPTFTTSAGDSYTSTNYMDTLLVAQAPWVDVTHTDYGADGTDSDDDSAAFIAAKDQADATGAYLLIPPGIYILDADITISSNVSLWFCDGAKLQVESGRTLTLATASQVVAPYHNRCFSGSGTVTFTSNFGFFSDAWNDGTNDNFGISVTNPSWLLTVNGDVNVPTADDFRIAGARAIDPNAYGASWNGSTVAPSRDAVYDQMQLIAGDMTKAVYDIAYDNHVDGNDVAYDSTWNGDVNAPAMNAIYDYLHQVDSDNDGSLTDETFWTGWKLDDWASPDDNTDLNVTTSAHGLMVKLPNDATKVFDGVGSWVDIETLSDEIAAGVAEGELADSVIVGADIKDGTVAYTDIQNVSATDKLLGRVSAGAGSIEEITITNYIQGLLDDTDEATLKASINLEIGTDVQAYHANLAAIAGGTWTGASSITTLGTIAAGVWQATDVGVAYGGTGASTLTDGGVLLGSGTGAITAMSVLADGAMIVGDGSTDPVSESGATLRTSIGVGTGDSPQFTGIELGHASDTTLARSGAGAITVEGVAVQTGTDDDVPEVGDFDAFVGGTNCTYDTGANQLNVDDAFIVNSGGDSATGDYYFGTNLFFIDDTNDRIGIGTTNPGAALDVRGDAIFNEDQLDKDFRIESNDKAYMFMVDGGSNRIVFGGTSSPDGVYDFQIDDATAYNSTEANGQRLNGNTIMLRNLNTGAGTFSQVLFRLRSGGLAVARIVGIGDGTNNDIDLAFVTEDNTSGPTEKMRIKNAGNVGIGEDSPSSKLEVAGDIEIVGGDLVLDVNNITADIVSFETYGTHIIDSSGAAITGTLAAGTKTGQVVRFVCKTAGNDIDITVANHVTSDPEVIRLDTAKETLVLIWDGTDWVEAWGCNGQTYP